MKPEAPLDTGFNMGILALKIAGKKNGVAVPAAEDKIKTNFIR